MVKRSGGESLAVEVFNQLRADIFDRRFAPGERLLAAELASRFGVSLGVLREALGLLAAQSLVQIERNRGFHVTTLSLQALSDLIVARKINEGAALRQSVERGGLAWESEVLKAHHLMASRAVYLPEEPARRNPEWVAAHMAFHYKLIEACGNQVLLDICQRLSDAAELYRAWSGAKGGGRKPRRDVAAEHKALMEAALAHDGDRAVSLFEAHIELTASIVLEVQPDLAADAADRVEPAR